MANLTRKDMFVDRNDDHRDKTGDTKEIVLPGGKKHEFVQNRKPILPLGHNAILYIPAGPDLEVGRVIGTHGPEPEDAYPAKAIKEQVDAVTVSSAKKSSWFFLKVLPFPKVPIIPAAWTSNPKSTSIHVNFYVHRASNSPFPMLRVVLKLTLPNSKSSEPTKTTRVEIMISGDALHSIDHIPYGEGEHMSLDLVTVKDIPRRIAHNRSKAVVTIVVRPNMETRVNCYDNTEVGPFKADVDALRNRMTTGGTFQLIIVGGQSLARELAELNANIAQAGPEHCLDHHLTVTAPTVKLEQAIIISRKDMKIHQAYQYTPTYHNLRNLLTAELTSLVREQEWALLQVQEREGYWARIASFPGSSNRHELLLYVARSPDRPLSLDVGDDVMICIRALNPARRTDLDWTGTVVGLAPGSRAADVLIHVKQSKIKHVEANWMGESRIVDTAEWAGRDPMTLKGVIDVTRKSTTADITAAVDAAQTFLIDIRKQPDINAFETRTYNLKHLHEIERGEKNRPNQISWLFDLVLASRLDRLPKINIFEALGLPKAAVTAFRENLDADQKPICNHMQAAPGATVIVQGPAGSGKTHSAIELTATIVKHKVATRQQNRPRQGARVLVITPTNDNVENLMKNCEAACSNVSEDPIVVRAFPEKTLLAIAQRGVAPLLEATETPREDHKTAKISTEKMKFASRMLFEDLLSRTQRHLDADPRVTQLGLDHSAAEWVSCACRDGVDTNVSPNRLAAVLRLRATIPTDVRSNFAQALDAYESSVRSGEPNVDDFRNNLREAIKKVYPYLYEAADVVIATPILAMSAIISEHFKAELIVMDEAAFLTSADSLAFIQYATWKGLILVGDTHQSRSRLESGLAWNEFHAQGEAPLMRRLIDAGFPSHGLRVQRRYCEAIADMLNEAFYHYDELLAHESVPTPTMLGRGFRQFPKNTSMITVSVPDSDEAFIPGTMSKINLKTAAACWDVINKLVAGGVAEEDMLLIAPYTGQYYLHVSIANQRAFAKGHVRSGITVQTVEKSQGGQKKVVIFDIPNVEKEGFLSEANRLLTGASRCQDGIIVVADTSAIRSWRGSDFKPLGIFLNVLKAGETVERRIADVKAHWTYKLMPNLESRSFAE